MERNQLKKYIELCIKNEEVIKPYIELLGAELSIYDVITENQRYIGQLLNIKEEFNEIIEDFAYSGKIRCSDDNSNIYYITDVDTLVDFLME